jgi:hypothetical protein
LLVESGATWEGELLVALDDLVDVGLALPIDILFG